MENSPFFPLGIQSDELLTETPPPVVRTGEKSPLIALEKPVRSLFSIDLPCACGRKVLEFCDRLSIYQLSVACSLLPVLLNVPVAERGQPKARSRANRNVVCPHIVMSRVMDSESQEEEASRINWEEVVSAKFRYFVKAWSCQCCWKVSWS